MKKFTTLSLISITTAAMLFHACKSQNSETLFASQETSISQFIESTQILYPDMRTVQKDGVNRLVLTEGTGEELQEAGKVSYYYAAYVFNGSVSTANLFATNSQAIASSANWTLSGEGQFNIMTVSPGESSLVSGLKRGLIGVKPGEECMIVFSGKYGFGGKQHGTIPANSALLYNIWVESVSNKTE